MANMSYCRWRNTRLDFEDCLRNLDDYDLSEEEKRARKQLIGLAYEMVQDFLNDDGELDEELIAEL